MVSVPIEAHRQFLLKDFSPKAYKVICEMLVSLPGSQIGMWNKRLISRLTTALRSDRAGKKGSVTSIIPGSEPTLPLILMLCPLPKLPHV
jgi:hypothetical protein